MNIAFVEVKNFRKLKSCRIELSKESTIFVGANNSGKTSAMLALIKFMKNRQLLVDDFTISNLPKIATIGTSYADESNTSVPTIADWSEVLPSLDIWLNVDETEVRYVANIIPTLLWNGGLIGIRLIFEPKDLEKLYLAYVDSYKVTQEQTKKIYLWPNDLCDFLSQKIGLFFTMNAYILDETKLVEPDEDNTAHPQTTQLLCDDGDNVWVEKMINQFFNYKRFHVLPPYFLAVTGMVVPLVITAICNVVRASVARLSRVSMQLAATFTAVDQTGK